jgi:hypothetical protein
MRQTPRYRGTHFFGSASAMGAMTYDDQFVPAEDPRSRGSVMAAPFQRPGPEVLSETIPVVFVGRNRDGFWVVRDAEARFGGLFWRQQAALDFAKAGASPGGYATVFPQARFELDMENHGNSLIGGIGAVKRLLTRRARQLIAAIRKLVAF